MANFLILAATSGIGSATAEILHANGHRVFLTGRVQEKIEPLASSLNAEYAVVDLTDFDATLAVFERAKAAMGSIDGVVNCSGSLLLRSAHLTQKSQYEDVISASLTTAFSTVRAAGKTMNAGGSVVLISSAAALEGLANHEAIAAAKAGIIGLTLSAAATYAPMNLRFNAIAPGLVETPLTTQLTSTEAARKISEAMHALGRIGTAQDIARAIVFLLDPENNWITGQVLAVDGGLSRVRPKLKV